MQQVVALRIDESPGGMLLAGDLRWGDALPLLLRDLSPDAPPLEVRLLWSDDRLFARLHSRSLLPAASGVQTLYLDPVGDRESYFEIGIDRSGSLWSRVARRGRSGTKFDPTWVCEGGEGLVSAGGSRVLAIPFASMGSILPNTEAGDWALGGAINGDFEKLRSAPPLVPLRFVNADS